MNYSMSNIRKRRNDSMGWKILEHLRNTWAKTALKISKIGSQHRSQIKKKTKAWKKHILLSEKKSPNNLIMCRVKTKQQSISRVSN